MRNEAIYILKDQLDYVRHDIEAVEIEMGDCIGGFDAIATLNRIQKQYERLANELEIAIQKLR